MIAHGSYRLIEPPLFIAKHSAQTRRRHDTHADLIADQNQATGKRGQHRGEFISRKRDPFVFVTCLPVLRWY